VTVVPEDLTVGGWHLPDASATYTPRGEWSIRQLQRFAAALSKEAPKGFWLSPLWDALAPELDRAWESVKNYVGGAGSQAEVGARLAAAMEAAREQFRLYRQGVPF
jgi:hypothetical protein